MSEVVEKKIEWKSEDEWKGLIECKIGLFDLSVTEYEDGSIYAFFGFSGYDDAYHTRYDECKTVEEAKQWCLDKVKEVCKEALAILGED